jgi:hypothetical protein
VSIVMPCIADCAGDPQTTSTQVKAERVVSSVRTNGGGRGSPTAVQVASRQGGGRQ